MLDNIIKVNDLIKIEKLEKNAKGYNLTLSDRTEPILVSPMLIAKHRLKSGIVITKPQIEQLVNEAESEHCDLAISRLLATRDHSSGDVISKLLKRGFEIDLIKREITKYEKKGLIDDTSFAHQLAIRTFERKPCGHSYLMATLLQKKIPHSIAESVVSTILSERDEVETAESALAAKWHSWRQFDLETTRKKAYNYLSRRGISYHSARQAFENMISKLEKE